MKISTKEDMGIADEMLLLASGSRARSACNYAQSAPKRTFWQFLMARSEGLQRKSANRKEDMGVTDKMAFLVLGSHVQREYLRTQKRRMQMHGVKFMQ